LLFKGYGAKVGLGNMRVKAENRMVTQHIRMNKFYVSVHDYFLYSCYKKCYLFLQ